MTTTPKKPIKGRKTSMSKTEEVTPTSTPRTLEEKIALTRALLAKYEAQANALQQINNVEVGDDITFNFGRADKVRSLTGVVQAVGDTEFGRMVAVLSGEGINAEIKKIRAEHITENRTAAARSGEAAPVATDEAPVADADPLTAE